jgi:hypothetical protein
MTILDFPTGGRAAAPRPRWPRSGASRAHPTSSALRRPAPSTAPAGEPPTGEWLDAYEQLAACCAEVVATPRLRVYDADWEDLVDWIRTRLAVLDALKAPGAS